MSDQMLNLMAGPMNRVTGMKTLNTKRLAALDPDRKGEQVRLGDVAVIDFEGEERELVFYSGRELLRRMLQDGAELRATGVMTRAVIEELIEEISAGGSLT
jgi:hypothetical protein